jgi:hypothetical protein
MDALAGGSSFVSRLSMPVKIGAGCRFGAHDICPERVRDRWIPGDVQTSDLGGCPTPQPHMNQPPIESTNHLIGDYPGTFKIRKLNIEPSSVVSG